MNTLIEQYNEFITSGDPTLREYFLLKSIKPMLTVITFYVLFVTSVGPAIMRHRKPLDLRRVIIVYNFSLVAYYAYFLLKGLYFLIMLTPSKVFCESSLDPTDPLTAEFYFHGYEMYIVRYIELIDTIFLVLSKKFRMITTLHVFHHSVLPVFGWFAFRTEKSGYLAAFMALNSIIHVIMYVYYAVAALGPEYQKYLWWKRYLTVLQIGQIGVMIVYMGAMYAIGCVTSEFTLLFLFGICMVVGYGFIMYYRNTFLKSEDKKVL